MRQLFLLLISIFFLSCNTGDRPGDPYVLWINSSMASCVGRSPAKCLQVQKSDQPDPSAWEIFQASIEGFEYEPGFIYKLVVRERKLEQAEGPGEAPALEYLLVEVLEKRQDMKFRIQGIWQLLAIGEEVLASLPEDITPPRLEIQVGEMVYSGKDGCNNITGGIIELNETIIRFGVAAGTRMMCPDMRIPDLFNAGLDEVNAWEIDDHRLHLFNAQGKELMQLSRSD